MTSVPKHEPEPVEVARAIAREVAGPHADNVDSDNRFPRETIEALRTAGLPGLLVPEPAGGMGRPFRDACVIAEALGAECLSTALIWAMHSQQVAIMADHAAAQWHDALADIAGRGALVASATTEPEKSSTLMLARAPLEPDKGYVRIDRPSPVVSYGAEADYVLVTMRAGPDRPETDVAYVLLTAAEGRVAGGWDAMGMRGTRSIPMRFEGAVPPDRVLACDFRRIAVMTAVPAAHLVWTSAWYGAARGALDRFVALLRQGEKKERRRLASDLFTTRLADVRLSLDLVEALLRRVSERYEHLRASAAPPALYEDDDWVISLNGLKVAGSRLSYAAVDSLITIAGLTRGYLRGNSLGLERVFRDLRSAPLMVTNDQLLQLNATRMLIRSPTTM